MKLVHSLLRWCHLCDKLTTIEENIGHTGGEEGLSKERELSHMSIHLIHPTSKLDSLYRFVADLPHVTRTRLFGVFKTNSCVNLAKYSNVWVAYYSMVFCWMDERYAHMRYLPLYMLSNVTVDGRPSFIALLISTCLSSKSPPSLHPCPGNRVNHNWVHWLGIFFQAKSTSPTSSSYFGCM